MIGKFTRLTGFAVATFALMGVCGIPADAVGPSIEKTVISSQDLNSCLDAASFFVSRDTNIGVLRKTPSFNSVEAKRRAAVSSLASIYRAEPHLVGFADSLDDPQVPVSSELQSDTAKSNLQKSAKYADFNYNFSIKKENKKQFVSVARLCNSFNRVKKIANSGNTYMYYVINIPEKKIDVQVDSSAPSEVVEDLERDKMVSLSFSEPFELLQGRSADYPPFAGGGAPTLSGTTARCSLGYKIQNLDSFQNYMTIAGHCSPLGSRWYYGTSYVGYAVTNYVQQSPGRLDVALLTGGSYAPRIFRGNGSAVAQVIGSLPGGGSVGAGIGVSAGYSNTELTGIYQGTTHDSGSSASGCAWLNGKEYCYLRTVQLSNGQLQGKDSGSPVFAYTTNPGQVYALGTVTGWRGSYSTIYYTDIEALLYATHSRVATS